MKRSRRHVFLIFLFLFTTTYVFSQTNSSLQNERMDVVKQYVKLLGDGNYQALSHLFTENAMAVSSSGKTDKPSHFYKILFSKTITNPEATLINVFPGNLDKNMMAAYFNFTWKNIKQQQVSAKFLDLFIFKKNTTKINAIYIFSNTFQKDIMKQLE